MTVLIRSPIERAMLTAIEVDIRFRKVLNLLKINLTKKRHLHLAVSKNRINIIRMVDIRVKSGVVNGPVSSVSDRKATRVRN